MPVDRQLVRQWSDYLASNPNRDSPEYQTVSRALQKAQAQMAEEEQAARDYGGLGGSVKAAAQGVRDSLPEGFNMVVPNPGRLGQIAYRMYRNQVYGDPYETPPNVIGEGVKRFVTGESGINPDALPPSARGSYRAGEFIGGSLPATLGTLGLGAVGGLGAGALGSIATSEAASIGGGAGAVKLADSIWGGDKTANAIAGAVGSIASPTALASMAARAASNAPGASRIGNAVADTLNPARGAARNLGAAITDSGENLDDVINALRASAGQPGTVAGDSQALHDIAAAIAQKNVRFGRELRAAEDASLGRLGDEVATTVGGTSGDDLSRAMRSEADALAQQAAQREAAARQAAQEFRPAGEDVRRASELLNNELDSAFRTRQSRGKDMYDALPLKNIAIPTKDLGEFSQLAVNLQNEGRALTAWMDDATKDLFTRVMTKPSSAQDLQNLRSNIYRNIRDMQNPGSPNRGQIDVASALGKKLGVILDRQGIPGWRDANAYTKQTYDAFERSHVGDMLRNTPQGQKVDPRELGNFVTTGTTNAQMGKIKDVRRALDLGERGGAMRADQWGLEPTIRQRIGEQVIDPATGMVNPSKAGNVLADELTGQFPLSRDRLMDAQSKAGAASAVRDLATEKTKTADTLGALFAERPDAALNSMIGGSKAVPMKSLDDLLVTAKKAPGGVDGLRGSLRSYIMQDDDPVKMAVRMSETVSEKGGTLLDWMRTNKLLTTTEYANLKGISDKVAKTGLMREMATARAVDLESRVPDWQQVIARIGGARLGAPLVPGAGAIQSAGIGSQYAKKLLNSAFGGQRQVRVMEDAFLNRNDRDLVSLLERYRRNVGGLGAMPGLPYPLRSAQVGAISTATAPDRQDVKKRRTRVLP